MNKKVLTLCAGFLLASNVTTFGEVFRLTTADAGYQAVGGTFSNEGVISRDESSAVGNMAFPTVSPFAVKTGNGAKPITELKHVNGNIAEDQYFQFVVGDSGSEGKEVLTMVWVKDNNGGQGHYELQVENVAMANIPSNRIILDRTLWKVTAKKETLGAGNTLYYTLQNKATDAILQISIADATDIGNGAKEVELNIVAGQTQWRWAEGEKAVAGMPSKFDPTGAPKVLQNQFSAQFSNGTTLYLVKKYVGGTSAPSAVKLTGLLLNSNYPFDSSSANRNYTATNGDVYQYVAFEAWEANPIILTANQINSELGKELLNGGQSNGKFKFTFDPDVVGPDANVMVGTDFAAVAAGTGANRVPGDAADGFVRFQKKNTNEFLMVDTTYYNEAAQDRYELKMAVREITFPRAAVQEDRAIYASIDKVKEAESNKSLYTASAPSYSAASYIQMKRQSNFRPIFYPATQTLRLQAEMIYKKAKTSDPWWKQVTEDMDVNHKLNIAEYSEDNTINPISTQTVGTRTAVNAVGYYPAIAAATNNAASVDETRVLAYKASYTIADNGYKPYGADYVENEDLWNAVANVRGFDSASDGIDKNDAPNVATAQLKHMLVQDPAVKSGEYKVIFSPSFAFANSNVVKLVTLTSGHKVLSTDIADPNDADYNGLLTNISIEGLRQNSDIPAVANIPEGYYYVQNENKNATQVAGVGDYRYEDLAATNAMFTYWNQTTQKWDRGVSGDGDGAKAGDSNETKNNAGINEATHGADNAAEGNLVYSEEKLAIPSAQWYIKGNGGHYKMINRESGRQWGTEYWWATNEPNVYINQATYTDAAGQMVTYQDTIRLTSVPASELNNPYLGYLNLSQEECQKDTTVFNIGMTSLGDVRFSLSEVNGVLTMTPDSTGAYKLERALVTDVDQYVSNGKHYTDELLYGFVRPDANNAAEVDTTQMLKRAKYYIYKDEVNANSGIEESSIKTREYITLSEGKYRLQDVTVKFGTVANDADETLYSFNTEVDESNPVPGTENVKYRRAFYIKQITPDANQFVLVDPEVVSVVDNNTGVKTYGARVFVNQLTGELQPGSLLSGGYANSYANSILNVEAAGKQNYADIRGGKDRANVKFSVEGNANWLLSENSNVEGAHVGLLELRQLDSEISNSIFVDTANVNDPAYPRFLLGVRNVDSVEVSNIPNHNHHILTKAAYLVNMIDSAATNEAYKYVNRDFNNTEWYRLGFVNATHKGSALTIDKTGKVFNLTDAGLAANGLGLNYATFAFRYVDTDRESFYIETQYNATKKGWLKIHNGVAVVTPDIQEAEVFTAAVTDEIATANEEIAASSVVVAGTNGAVVVKGAEGKSVIVSTILGKVVANEVLTSDNAQIAAPQGVVVVSVDGESFKVVVK